MKKSVSLILCLLLVLSLSVPAFADTVQSRTVIGADLNEAQIAAMYSQFGIRRGQVVELKVTNEEERKYLDGVVDRSLIGTRAISCVFVELLPQGRGITVTTKNINWCTAKMYANALATAGITDARIVVAAPFAVSGTAALTGIYKAYEHVTGTRVAETTKLASMKELAITGSLAQSIGDADSLSIVGELKQMLDQTRNMSDAELRATILEIAGKYQVSLTDAQIGQLVSLCRTLESLDPDQIRQRVAQAQEALQKLSETKTKIAGFLENFKSFLDSINSFFDSVREMMARFS